MEYELWKKVERDINEDGEVSKRKEIFYLINREDEKEQDDWAEYQASECGYQDYYYQVEFKLVGVFDEIQMNNIMQLFQNKLALTELERGIVKEEVKCIVCRMGNWDGYGGDYDSLCNKHYLEAENEVSK